MCKFILTSAILLASASVHAGEMRGLTTPQSAKSMDLPTPVEQAKTKPLSVAEQLKAVGEMKADGPAKGQVTYLPAKDEARPPVEPADVKAQAKPLEAPKPAEIKPVETRTADPKPAEAKPAAATPAKPAEAVKEPAKPVEAAPAAKTADVKPADQTTQVSRPRVKRHASRSIEGRIRSELRRYGIAVSRYGLYW